jgi:hypothetical protein
MRLAAHLRVAAVMAALIAPVAPAAATLLVNGGFETGDFTGWTRSGAAGFTNVNDSNPIEGDYAAFFSPNNIGRISQTIVTHPGEVLRLRFALAHSFATAGPVNSFSATFGGTALVALNNLRKLEYTNFVYSFASPGGVQNLTFAFRDIRPTGFFLDDVSLEAIPEPASWGLLLIGFGAVGLAVRRRRAQAPLRVIA